MKVWSRHLKKETVMGDLAWSRNDINTYYGRWRPAPCILGPDPAPADTFLRYLDLLESSTTLLTIKPQRSRTILSQTDIRKMRERSDHGLSTL